MSIQSSVKSSVQSAVLSKIPGIVHGFGDLAHPIPQELAPMWNIFKPQWKQVHGDGVAEVSSPNQICGEVDALTSSSSLTPIGIITADCVPILLAKQDGSQIAAIHAGWRGTHQRILYKLWEKLRSKGENPRHWKAAIGPCIGPCCYEVSEDLMSQFHSTFSALGISTAASKKRHLDLADINRQELAILGLSSIDLIRACTRCAKSKTDEYLFHSYRREGAGHRQFSLIMIQTIPSKLDAVSTT